MSRAYQGNVMDNVIAMERVERHGFFISAETWSNPATMGKGESLAIYHKTSGIYPELLVTKTFDNHDEDVMLNEESAWLNQIADDLDYWQSKG